MKTFGFVSTSLAVLLFVAVGCGTVRGGRTVVKFESGQAPITTSVPHSGTYALYATTDYNPKSTVQLKEGDVIGFKSSQTGEVIAVAGDHEFPLSAGSTYYWKVKS